MSETYDDILIVESSDSYLGIGPPTYLTRREFVAKFGCVPAVREKLYGGPKCIVVARGVPQSLIDDHGHIIAAKAWNETADSVSQLEGTTT